MRRIVELQGYLPPKRLNGMPGRLHRNDHMFYGPASAYAQLGKATADVILDAAADTTPESWLDYGCGYGRVLRWLTQHVSPESVGCYDVNPQAVTFCSDEFGVAGLRSGAPLSTLTLGRWDFVYAISVVTHLPGNDFFALLGRLLNPGGTVLFTSHGQWSVDHIASYGSEYAAQEARVRSDLTRNGIGYLPYPYGDGTLGMTWHTHDYVLDQMRGLTLVSHQQTAAPGNHDVYVFRRDAG
jgi:SAM-dependent methyltransferase